MVGKQETRKSFPFAFEATSSHLTAFPEWQLLESARILSLVSESSLRRLLNEIVRTSEAKYWIVKRFGDRNEYFLLNFMVREDAAETIGMTPGTLRRTNWGQARDFGNKPSPMINGAIGRL